MATILIILHLCGYKKWKTKINKYLLKIGLKKHPLLRSILTPFPSKLQSSKIKYPNFSLVRIMLITLFYENRPYQVLNLFESWQNWKFPFLRRITPLHVSVDSLSYFSNIFAMCKLRAGSPALKGLSKPLFPSLAQHFRGFEDNVAWILYFIHF